MHYYTRTSARIDLAVHQYYTVYAIEMVDKQTAHNRLAQRISKLLFTLDDPHELDLLSIDVVFEPPFADLDVTRTR